MPAGHRCCSYRIGAGVGGEIPERHVGASPVRSDRFRDRVGPAFIAAVDHDPDTFRREELGDRLAETRARTGNQGALAR